MNKLIEKLMPDCWGLEPKYRKIIEKHIKLMKQQKKYQIKNFSTTDPKILPVIRELKKAAENDPRRLKYFEELEKNCKKNA